MLMRWDWPCVTKEGEKSPFEDPFKAFTYYRSETHGAVVGNVLWIASFMFWAYVMAKRQSEGTTPVVRELANSLDKGSAKKSASQRTIWGWMPSGPAPFESSLCTTGIENCGTDCISRWVAVVLDERQMFTFLCTFVFRSEPGKSPSSWHRTERNKRSRSSRIDFLMWYHWSFTCAICDIEAQSIPLAAHKRIYTLALLWRNFGFDIFPAGRSDATKFTWRVAWSLLPKGARWWMEWMLLLYLEKTRSRVDGNWPVL